MYPRTVLITLEVETDFPTSEIKASMKTLSPGAPNKLFKVNQVQVNVVDQTKKRPKNKKKVLR